MDLYRVTAGPIQMGPGSIFSIDEAQMKRRTGRVRRIEKVGERFTVIADDLLDFKQGETLGLVEEPKHLVGRIEKLKGVEPIKDGPKTAKAIAGKDKRQADIIAAIGQLNPDNPKHFRTDGMPAVGALEKALGFQISAAERDKAWKASQAK